MQSIGVGGAAGTGGGAIYSGIPRKKEMPGSMAPLPLGTVVIVDLSLGFPYIDGVLNIYATKAAAESEAVIPAKTGDLDTSEVYPDGSAGFYREPGVPENQLAGDWGYITEEGNYLAVLRGKENVLYGSEKAQVRTIGSKDLVRIVCEDYENYNAFGKFEIFNEEGRAGLRLRGGRDQLTESGGSEEQFTFHLDVGDEGDYLNLEIKAPGGATLSRFHMSADGRIEIIGVNGVDIVNGGKAPKKEDIGGDSFTRIQGSEKKTVLGDASRMVEGARRAEISGSDIRTIGTDDAASIANDQVTNVGGRRKTIVSGGNALKANPTNFAVEESVVNGSYMLDIGNPLSGGNPAAMAGFNVAVYNGEVTLGANKSPLAPAPTKCFVNLNTLTPNSVALGGTIGPGPTMAVLSAMMFEPWATLMGTLITLLDAHTHTTAWGPSGPAMAPAPAGFNTAISSQLATVRSTKVKIGG